MYEILIFWTADKYTKVEMIFQLNEQPEPLKKNLKKFRLDRESNRLTFAMTAHNTLNVSIVTLIKATGEQAIVSL